MLAIIAAFRQELAHFLKRGKFQPVARHRSVRFYQTPADQRLVVVVGGVGKQGAQEATRQAIERYRPEFIVCAGFAGGVQPGLKTGDIFVCDKLLSVDGPAALWSADTVKERQPVDPAMVTMLNAPQADLETFAWTGCLSVPQFVPSGSMKSWIGANFPVSIIDMESYWVSETAAANGIPHLVVRSVLDTVSQTLPEFVGSAVDDEGGRRWDRAARYLFWNPTQVPALIRSAMQVKAAGASLSGFLAALGRSPIISTAAATN